LEARNIEIREQVPASKKLQQDDAERIYGQASKMIVAKGKKVSTFKAGDAEAIAHMLGSTGNLRAPLLIRGKTVVVGFNEQVYSDVFGG
tara:strand:- start:62 stop:328 length:267 start_codon:yes stop_codon:yes gene_type:complete